MNDITQKKVGKGKNWFLTIPKITKEKNETLGKDENSIRRLIRILLDKEVAVKEILVSIERGNNNIGYIGEAITALESIENSSESAKKGLELIKDSLDELLPYHLHIFITYQKIKNFYYSHFDYLGKHGDLTTFNQLEDQKLTSLRSNGPIKIRKRTFLMAVEYMGKESGTVYTNISLEVSTITYFKKRNITLRNIENEKESGVGYHKQRAKFKGIDLEKRTKKERGKEIISLYLAKKLENEDIAASYFREVSVEPNSDEIRYLDRDPVFKKILMFCTIAGKKAASQQFLNSYTERNTRLFKPGMGPLETESLALNNSRWSSYDSEKVKDLYLTNKRVELLTTVKKVYTQVFNLLKKLFYYRLIRELQNTEGGTPESRRDNNFYISGTAKTGKTKILKLLTGYFSTLTMPPTAGNIDNWENWRDDLISWNEVTFKNFAPNYLKGFLEGCDVLIGSRKLYKEDYPVVIATSNETLEEKLKKDYGKESAQLLGPLKTRFTEINLDCILIETNIQLTLFSLLEYFDKLLFIQWAIGILRGELLGIPNEISRLILSRVSHIQRQIGPSVVEQEKENYYKKIAWLEQVQTIISRNEKITIKIEKLEELKLS